MSNTKVKSKMIDVSSKLTGWARLAEDADQDAKKALIRSRQLATAAKIFRSNVETGVPFPTESTQSTDHKSEPATQC